MKTPRFSRRVTEVIIVLLACSTTVNLILMFHQASVLPLPPLI